MLAYCLTTMRIFASSSACSLPTEAMQSLFAASQALSGAHSSVVLPCGIRTAGKVGIEPIVTLPLTFRHTCIMRFSELYYGGGCTPSPSCPALPCPPLSSPSLSHPRPTCLTSSPLTTHMHPGMLHGHTGAHFFISHEVTGAGCKGTCFFFFCGNAAQQARAARLPDAIMMVADLAVRTDSGLDVEAQCIDRHRVLAGSANSRNRRSSCSFTSASPHRATDLSTTWIFMLLFMVAPHACLAGHQGLYDRLGCPLQFGLR